MNPENQTRAEQRARDIFLRAVELASPEARAAYMEGACGPDAALRARVEALLRSHQDDSFLEVAAVAEADTVSLGKPLSEGPGTRIGRYKLLEKLGEGGMGVVYMAEQTEPVVRKVALKIIKLGMDTRAVIARFEAERQALALMDHPHIAKILDAGATESGRPYFVMELVRGVPITEYCDQHHLPARERLQLFITVCQAVQHAHSKGIIHRDLKPSNVLVTLSDGVAHPMVIDFGVAKATHQKLTEKTLFTHFAQLIGTPAYMSPEQAELSKLDVDTRSDIYSLGVLLYELLTGKPPFETRELLAAGYEALRRMIRETEPPKPSTRLGTMQAAERTAVARNRGLEPQALAKLFQGDLDWVVMKCLEKDRTRRYESASGLAADLTRHLGDQPVEARPPSVGYRLQKLVRRQRAGIALAAGGVVVLCIGAGLMGWRSRRAMQAAQAAEAEARQRAQAESERARQAEAAEAERAAAEAAARLALSTADFRQAVRLIEADQAADAVAYLVRSLQTNPTNEAALTRLATLLAYRTWMLPTVVVTNGSAVNAAELSPDGTRLVTAAADGNARLWNAQTGQQLHEPMKHPVSVSAAEFSGDGRKIVTASGATVRVWDAGTGQPLTGPLSDRDGDPEVPADQAVAPTTPPSPMAAGRWVSDVQFSLAGDRVLTLTQDRKLRVWDVGSGQLVSGPMQHTNGIMTADFSLDGKRIETRLGKGLFVEWDVATGQPLGERVSRTNRVDAARLSLDGRRQLTNTTARTVRVLDAQTGQPLTEPMPHDAEVTLSRFTLDGQRIVTVCTDHTVRIWEPQTSPPLPLRPPFILIHGGGAWTRWSRPQFSHDDRRVVMPSTDRTTRVWDALTGEPLLRTDHDRAVVSAQFNPNDTRIVTASRGGITRAWDAQTGIPVTEPMKHESMVLQAQFSPDGTRIVTGSQDKTARVWDAQTGKPLTEPVKHEGPVNKAEFSPDGTRILTASSGGIGTVRVWDAQTGQPLTVPMNHESGVDAAHFSPDGKRIVTGSSDGTARVWDASTGRPVTVPMKHGAAVTGVEFSPDGGRIVTASRDGTARVWNAETGQPLTEPMKPGNQRVVLVFSAQFSPDGKRIATSVSKGDRPGDYAACVWDAQTGQPLTDLVVHSGEVNSTQFSRDGRRILTATVAGADSKASLWDVAPAPAPGPDWLPQLAEAIAGIGLNQGGLLEPTRLDRIETLRQTRRKLAGQPEDEWVKWGRWLLADRATRAISFLAKITVPELADRNLQENTLASLQELAQFSPTNSMAFARLALVVKENDRMPEPARLESAKHYARLAVKLEPGNGEAWHALGAVFAQAGRPAEAFVALDRALELQPANARAWEVRGQLLENTNRLEEAFGAFTRQVEAQFASANQEPRGRRNALLNRARVLRRLGRLEEAARDVAQAHGISKREDGDLPGLVDLSAFYDAGFKGNWFLDPGDYDYKLEEDLAVATGTWRGRTDNDLSELPVGIQELAGTRFDVRGRIMPRSRPDRPLPVLGKDRRVHFLHGATMPRASVPAGTEIGKYVFHYQDGTTADHSIVMGKDVLDWFAEPPASAAGDGLVVAWTGRNAKSRAQGRSIRLYKSTWANPKPDVEVTGMDFISAGTGAAPFLIAVTVE